MENETADKSPENKKEDNRRRLKISLIILIAVVAAAIFAVRGPIKQIGISTKNAARRADYEFVISNIKEFISEHGSYPNPLTTLPSDLLKGKFTDPDGNNYILRMVYCGSGYIACPGSPKVTVGEILVISYAKCNADDGLISLSDDPNDYAVWGYQQGTSPACVGSN